MTQTTVMELIQNLGWTVLLLSGPLLGVGLLIGLAISIVQVVTSIQDPTLSFVPRMLVVLLAGLLLLSWMMQTLVGYTAELFSQLAVYAQ